MKNSTKNIKNLNNNEEIANAFDHLTPPNYPIAYKAGKWFFCGLPFFVTEDVLVPRVDTEILIRAVQEYIESQTQSQKFPSKIEGWMPRADGVFEILDLCTGSGCIAVALTSKGFTNVTAVDICEKALAVASKNAETNNVNVNFIQSDLFKNIKTRFDIIVTNPPYIKTNEIGIHDKSILCEPRKALDGGADGLDIYRRIINEAPNYLNAHGQIFLEIGDVRQAEQVKTLLQNGGFHDIQIIKDRVVIARNVSDEAIPIRTHKAGTEQCTKN